jgi:hypothetical protein
MDVHRAARQFENDSSADSTPSQVTARAREVWAPARDRTRCFVWSAATRNSVRHRAVPDPVGRQQVGGPLYGGPGARQHSQRAGKPPSQAWQPSNARSAGRGVARRQIRLMGAGAVQTVLVTYRHQQIAVACRRASGPPCLVKRPDAAHERAEAAPTTSGRRAVQVERGDRRLEPCRPMRYGGRLLAAARRRLNAVHMQVRLEPSMAQADSGGATLVECRPQRSPGDPAAKRCVPVPHRPRRTARSRPRHDGHHRQFRSAQRVASASAPIQRRLPEIDAQTGLCREAVRSS